MEPALAEMVLEAVMAARGAASGRGSKAGATKCGGKGGYRRDVENMPTRIVPTPAMAQNALAVSGA